MMIKMLRMISWFFIIGSIIGVLISILYFFGPAFYDYIDSADLFYPSIWAAALVICIFVLKFTDSGTPKSKLDFWWGW